MKEKTMNTGVIVSSSSCVSSVRVIFSLLLHRSLFTYPSYFFTLYTPTQPTQPHWHRNTCIYNRLRLCRTFDRTVSESDTTSGVCGPGVRFERERDAT
jgi:hypothetical protein